MTEIEMAEIIDSMPAGREMDELFAKREMKLAKISNDQGRLVWSDWQGKELYDHDRDELPYYSQDEELFWDLARTEQWPVIAEPRSGDAGTYYIARHRAVGGELARAETVNLAVMRALIKLADGLVTPEDDSSRDG